ncbi:hypothetical protein STIAU_4733 [Stigmatella aurantiaca DW4/3-1]|uniref:Uncharacterized protein n=1 Tax=Stigmatella aurantiaca (strain DW4/3-1) TaxID=378806 RepID=Q08NL8_STIAD|nr:hypothetical protein STIAU_4733 [Stigmatella aurantiaca DW4/3-1]
MDETLQARSRGSIFRPRRGPPSDGGRNPGATRGSDRTRRRCPRARRHGKRIGRRGRAQKGGRGRGIERRGRAQQGRRRPSGERPWRAEQGRRGNRRVGPHGGRRRDDARAHLARAREGAEVRRGERHHGEGALRGEGRPGAPRRDPGLRGPPRRRSAHGRALQGELRTRRGRARHDARDVRGRRRRAPRREGAADGIRRHRPRPHPQSGGRGNGGQRIRRAHRDALRAHADARNHGRIRGTGPAERSRAHRGDGSARQPRHGLLIHGEATAAQPVARTRGGRQRRPQAHPAQRGREAHGVQRLLGDVRHLGHGLQHRPIEVDLHVIEGELQEAPGLDIEGQVPHQNLDLRVPRPGLRQGDVGVVIRLGAMRQRRGVDDGRVRQEPSVDGHSPHPPEGRGRVHPGGGHPADATVAVHIPVQQHAPFNGVPWPGKRPSERCPRCLKGRKAGLGEFDLVLGGAQPKPGLEVRLVAVERPRVHHPVLDGQARRADASLPDAGKRNRPLGIEAHRGQGPSADLAPLECHAAWCLGDQETKHHRAKKRTHHRCLLPHKVGSGTGNGSPLDETPGAADLLHRLVVLDVERAGALLQVLQPGARLLVDLIVHVEVLLHHTENLRAQHIVGGEHFLDIAADEQELDHLVDDVFDALVAHLEAADVGHLTLDLIELGVVVPPPLQRLARRLIHALLVGEVLTHDGGQIHLGVRHPHGLDLDVTILHQRLNALARDDRDHLRIEPHVSTPHPVLRARRMRIAIKQRRVQPQ